MCSSPLDHTYSHREESSSRLGHSDLPDVEDFNVSSECECDKCKVEAEPLDELLAKKEDEDEEEDGGPSHDEDPDLENIRTSEFDEEPKDLDHSILSPCSAHGYSSCDER